MLKSIYGKRNWKISPKIGVVYQKQKSVCSFLNDLLERNSLGKIFTKAFYFLKALNVVIIMFNPLFIWQDLSRGFV